MEYDLQEGVNTLMQRLLSAFVKEENCAFEAACLSAAEKSVTGLTGGNIPRPHCFAASTEIFCQRSTFLSRFLVGA